MIRARTSTDMLEAKARAASSSAQESYEKVARMAQKVSDEMEEITENAIPIGPLSDEDSLVLQLNETIVRSKAASKPPENVNKEKTDER